MATNSAWRRFLESLAEEEFLTLVGPLHQRALPLTRGPTVFVDGGVLFRTGNRPNSAATGIHVGDGDSSGSRVPDEVLPRDKDHSDLAYVLMNLPVSIRHLALLGFLGGRRDHELANFGEVNRFLEKRRAFAQADFYASRKSPAHGDRPAITAFSGGPLSLDLRGPFTVFLLREGTAQIEGECHYQCPEPKTFSPLSSLGLSNEAYGRVKITSSSPCFVVRQSEWDLPPAP